VRRGYPGLQPDRRAQLVDGAFNVAGLLQGDSEVVVGVRQVRVQFQGLPVLGQGVAPGEIDSNGTSAIALAPSGVTVYDLRTNGVMMAFNVDSGFGPPVDANGSSSFAMAPSGQLIYVLNNDGILWEYNTAAPPVELDKNGTGEFAMAPNGMTVYDLEWDGVLLRTPSGRERPDGPSWTLPARNSLSWPRTESRFVTSRPTAIC
jgi:hypothetical protein